MKKDAKRKEPKKDDKKKDEKKKEQKQEEPAKEPEPPAIVETKGNGRFEYANGTVYIGDYIDRNGSKTKNGYGKALFEGNDFTRF